MRAFVRPRDGLVDLGCVCSCGRVPDGVYVFFTVCLLGCNKDHPGHAQQSICSVPIQSKFPPDR